MVVWKVCWELVIGRFASAHCELMVLSMWAKGPSDGFGVGSGLAVVYFELMVCFGSVAALEQQD